jgi:hypothetical protein
MQQPRSPQKVKAYSGLASPSDAVADISLTYVEGTGFTENDSAGTIARLSSRRIPNGATVQVSYVAPPITRSSLEPGAHRPPRRARTPCRWVRVR